MTIPGSPVPGPIDQPGQYYVSKFTGSVQRQDNRALGLALNLAGYEGPMDYNSAVARSQQVKVALGDVNQSVKSSVGLGGVGGDSGSGSGSSSSSGSPNWSHFLVRIAEFGAGVILIAVGVSAIAGRSPVVQQGRKVATAFATRGKG